MWYDTKHIELKVWLKFIRANISLSFSCERLVGIWFCGFVFTRIIKQICGFKVPKMCCTPFKLELAPWKASIFVIQMISKSCWILAPVTTCPEGYFRCADRSCVDGRRCDGRQDCADNSDEYQCGKLVKYINSKFSQKCIWKNLRNFELYIPPTCKNPPPKQ